MLIEDWFKFRRGRALALCVDGSQPCKAELSVSVYFKWFSHLRFPILLWEKEHMVLFSALCDEFSVQTEILSFTAAFLSECVKGYARGSHEVTPCQREKTTVECWGKSVALSTSCPCISRSGTENLKCVFEKESICCGNWNGSAWLVVRPEVTVRKFELTKSLVIFKFFLLFCLNFLFLRRIGMEVSFFSVFVESVSPYLFFALLFHFLSLLSPYPGSISKADAALRKLEQMPSRDPFPSSVFDGSVIQCLCGSEMRNRLGTPGRKLGKIEMATEHQPNTFMPL